MIALGGIMMNNKERIAKWRKLHKRTKLALTHEIAGLMLDMLEQQQAEIDEAHGWIARAMMKGCCEEDITKEALQKFIDKRDLEQQLKGVEDALKNIPETRHGNWPMALVRKYVIDMRQKVKNGGNDD